MLRIATRRSALARAQAFQTGKLIQRATSRPFELVPLATTGDEHPERAIAAFDAKGLFVDRLRQAVLEGDCDLAVHSYKDLPTEPYEGLTVAAVPGRADPRDLLVSSAGHTLAGLPPTATVGTSSERRRLQLLRVKPGLQVLAIRGNLDTRLRKVADGEFDAAVVAMAGLSRLYRAEQDGGVGPLRLPLKAVPLEPGEVLPAPAQGALAIEIRADDARLRRQLDGVDHLPSHRAVDAERAFLAALGGGCTTPVGALCSLTGIGGLELIGMLGDPARRRMVRRSLTGPFDDPVGLGHRLAADVRDAWGEEIPA